MNSDSAVFADVDATEHYRQEAHRLAKNQESLLGVVLGAVTMYIGLLLWEVLK